MVSQGNEVAAAKFLAGQIQQDYLKTVGAGANMPANSSPQQQVGNCIGVFSCIAVSGVGTPNNAADQEEQTIQNIVANTQPQNFFSAIAQLPEALQVRVATAYPRQSLAQALELSPTEFGNLPESTQLVIAGLIKAEAAQVGSCIGLFSCIAVTGGAGQAPPLPPAPPPQQVGGSCIGVFSCIAVSGVGTAVPPNLDTLPLEMQFQVMDSLSAQDLTNLSRTSRALQTAVLSYVQALINNGSLVYTARFQGGRRNGWSVRGTHAHDNNPQEVLRLWTRGEVTKQPPQVGGNCIGLFSCIAVSGVGQAPQPPQPPEQVGSCIGVFSCIAVSGVGAGNDPAEQEQQTIQSIVANTLPQNFINTIAQLPEALQVRVAFAYPPQSLAQAIELSQAEFGSLPESTQLVIAGLVKAEATQVGSCIGLFSCIAVTGAGQASTPPPPQQVGGGCIGIFSCIAVSGVGAGVPQNLESLPGDMQYEIMRRLSPQELVALSATSTSLGNAVLRYFQRLIDSGSLSPKDLITYATSGYLRTYVQQYVQRLIDSESLVYTGDFDGLPVKKRPFPLTLKQTLEQWDEGTLRRQ